jgi:hypothetical protein
MLPTHLYQVLGFRMSGAIFLLPPVRLLVVDRDKLYLPLGPNPALGCDM